MTVPSTRFPTPQNVGGTPLYLPRRAILKGTIAAAAVGFWASACGPAGSSSSAGGKSSKTTLVEAAAAMPVTLAMDTGRGVGYEGFEVWQLVQANLVRNRTSQTPMTRTSSSRTGTTGRVSSPRDTT
jgi:hypothetical protein